MDLTNQPPRAGKWPGAEGKEKDMENRRNNELEAELAADRAREEQRRQERDARAAQALADAQKALDQSGVSIPPGARGH